MAVLKLRLSVMAIIQWEMPKKLGIVGADILMHLFCLHVAGHIRDGGSAPILALLDLSVASDTIYHGIHLD